MIKENSVKAWLNQIRAPFLILAVVLVLVGVAEAYRQGVTHLLHSILLGVGIIVSHIGVNLFNELSDYKTGIDEHTNRTPFSGGSGMMQAGKTKPATVTAVAYLTLVISFAIGLYFCFTSGWLIAVFMEIGGISIRFYTSHLARYLLGELFAGLSLGSLVVLGTFYALTGTLTVTTILLSIPPGILTSLLLFLNEFPDLEADKKGGRRHLLIHFGRKKCARIYAFTMGLFYLIIIALPLVTALPLNIYLVLLTLPLALKATAIVLKNPEAVDKLVPAQGMNVGVVILGDLLLAIGLFWAGI
jgi:1,4-dihydroxy-2-naphthoate octaprenyltransferase